MKKRFYEYLLLPFTSLYWLVVTIRNKLFDLNILPSEEFNLPVICVGNITVGGTGKTPHTEYLVRILRNEYRVAVLSRGYKRKTSGFLIASEHSTPEEIGDEPCQIKNKFPDIIVAVDEKRRRGIRNLLNLENGPDVILMDDAFQHRYVKPGLSIVLEDFNRPVRKDFLLPYGRLREPVSSLKRAAIILVTKVPSSFRPIDRRLRAREAGLSEFQHLYYTQLNPGKPLPVFKGDFKEYENSKPDILLVSGIANPRSLKPFARKFSTKIREIIFRDHHIYSPEEMKKIYDILKNSQESILLTTEKDAVKFRSFRKILKNVESRLFYLPVDINFLNDDEPNFKKQILNYVSSNKRNSILHKQ